MKIESKAKTILLPFDGSSASNRAIETVTDMVLATSEKEYRIIILHVIPQVDTTPLLEEFMKGEADTTGNNSGLPKADDYLQTMYKQESDAAKKELEHRKGPRSI